MNKEEAKKGHIFLRARLSPRSSKWECKEFAVDIAHNDKAVIIGGVTQDRDMLINLIRSHAYSCGLMVLAKEWLVLSHRETMRDYE